MTPTGQNVCNVQMKTGGCVYILLDCWPFINILKIAILFCQACHRIQAISKAIMQRFHILESQKATLHSFMPKTVYGLLY